MGRCKIALTPTEHCVLKSLHKHREARIREENRGLSEYQLGIKLMLEPATDADIFKTVEAVDMSYSKVKTLYYGYGPWKEKANEDN